MKTRFLVASVAVVLVSVLLSSVAWADELAGVSDVTVEDGVLVSFRFDGTEYATDSEDLMLGTTTRWYVAPDTGVETLWEEGGTVPPSTVTGTSNPKGGDVGSKGDNYNFTLDGATNISSIDGIDFQQTVFPLTTEMIFVFERNGNDNGTVQGILPDGSLTPTLPLVSGGAPYASTGVNVNGQTAHGYVYISDEPVIGLRITASGHDTLSISAVPIPFDPQKSHHPQPETELTDVLRDVVLSWTAGEFAATHDVYLGTSLDDVNNASRADPRGVLVSEGQTEAAFDAGRLEFGQTYYWRVDEVNAAPDSTIFQGELWFFTVELLAYPVENIIATSASAEADSSPQNTVDGSGLNEQDEHSIDAPDMWLGIPVDGAPVWIQYEFDKILKLHEMAVWNYNVAFEIVLGFGFKDVTVEYSTDGSDWAVLGEVQFAQATATASYTANTTVDFGGVAAKFVRLTANSGYGMLGQFGLSEVRFLSIPVQAQNPQPANEATDVEPDVILNWRPGREAAVHEVLVSADEDAVADGSALVDAVETASFDTASLNLELDMTYYWKINEVNEAEAVSVWAGDVYSFTTIPYFVVDDFESYDDDENAIFDTWLDGFVNETGSTVGNLDAPFAERVIINSGQQAMPLFYENTGGTTVSEAEREFDSFQDWTRAGAAILTIHYRGAADNVPGQLYVEINGIRVTAEAGAVDFTTEAWTAWEIELSAVGTNLTNVRGLAIGIEGSGSGVLYIDDIRLRPGVRTAPPMLDASPVASVDITGDNGMVLSINGIDVSNLILATTSSDFEKFPDHPATDADDFDLATYASLDDSGFVQAVFAVPVSTVFIIERGANDQGLIEALDADGNAIGGPAAFAQGDWHKPGVKINNQDAGAMAIEAEEPISGIRILPPAGGNIGIDPASISGVPAN